MKKTQNFKKRSKEQRGCANVFKYFKGKGLYYKLAFKNLGVAWALVLAALGCALSGPQTPDFADPVLNPFGLELENTSYVVPCFADIDGDRDLDAFIATDQAQVYYFKNTGSKTSPHFGLKKTYALNQFVTPGSVIYLCSADLNGDNKPDFLLGDSQGNLFFFENQCYQNIDNLFAYGKKNDSGLGQVHGPAIPFWADIDGDGDKDALIGNGLGQVIYYQNTGTKTNLQFTYTDTNYFNLQLDDIDVFAGLCLADLDSDRRIDLMLITGNGDFLYFRNEGSYNNPSFAEPVTKPFGLINCAQGTSPAFVDIDGDRDLDGFMGDGAGQIWFFENKAK